MAQGRRGTAEGPAPAPVEQGRGARARDREGRGRGWCSQEAAGHGGRRVGAGRGARVDTVVEAEGVSGGGGDVEQPDGAPRGRVEQVHGCVKVGGDLVEPRGIKLGDNVRLPAHQCHGDGRWCSRGDERGDRRGVFLQGQFKLVPKRLMFLRLRLGVSLMKLEH